MTGHDDYHYIIRIIQYLKDTHRIHLFIGSADFDVLYGWWTKRIPFDIVFRSIDEVVSKWQKKEKSIDGFKRFSYRVRKNFSHFMELNVAVSDEDSGSKTVAGSGEGNDGRFTEFIENVDEKIAFLRDDFSVLYHEKESGNKQKMLDAINEKLLDTHADDPVLEIKTKEFMMNLNPVMRTDEMIQKYRINNLYARYRIPEILLFFPDSDDIG